MKEYYQIGEISRLYQIGRDSLMYYEKLGMISPRRSPKGYRLYSLHDIWKLNVIRDLRSLNFSIAQIKAYLASRTLESTFALLQTQIQMIDSKISDLQRQKEHMKQRINNLQSALCSAKEGRVFQVSLPQRSGTVIRTDVQRDEEIDFLLQKLHSQRDESYLLGNTDVGSVIPLKNVLSGHYQQFSAVFLLDADYDPSGDFQLPSGEYLTLLYRGSYQKSAQYLSLLVQYAKEHHQKLDSDFYELYTVDIHETNVKDEFLTQLQVKILP